MTLPYDLNILDVVLLSVIALFTLRGALRGFLDEVAGLVGILGGVWLAGRYYGELGRIFSQYTTSQWVYIVAYVLILCMVMFVISMISRALHSFLKMAYADWINHLAGAAVGGGDGEGAGSGAPRSFSDTSVPNSSETVRSSTPAEVRVALDLGWGRRVTRMYMGWSLQTPRSCSLTSRRWGWMSGHAGNSGRCLRN